MCVRWYRYCFGRHGEMLWRYVMMVTGGDGVGVAVHIKMVRRCFRDIDDEGRSDDNAGVIV